MTIPGMKIAGGGKSSALALILALGSTTAAFAATAKGLVSGTTAATTTALSRATVCLASDTTACWLTRTTGNFALTYTPTAPPPVNVSLASRQLARIAGNQMELPIARSGLYRLEAVNTSGRVLEQRTFALADGLQRIALPASVLESQGIAFLRVSGPGGTWNARLVHGKGSIAPDNAQASASSSARTAAATDAIIVSAQGFVSQTVTLPTDSVARQNLSVTLVRDPLVPRFSPDAGPFGAAFSLSLSTGITNGIIRYTTDGTAPTTLSAGYSAPLSISTDTNFRALVFRSGVAQGAIVDAVYRKSIGVLPVAGTYLGFVHATVTNLKGDERYTLDGSIPTPASPKWDGQLGLDIDQDAFLVVRSFQPRAYPEAVEYTIQDTSLTPRGLGAAFYDTTVVTLTSMWPDAEIHYTTDSTTPTRISPLYTKPFGVWKTCTVKAIAFRQGSVSSVASIPFARVTPIPAPIIDTSIAAGFTDSVLVALYGVKNVPIRYTVDGSVPSGNSPIYTGPFYLKKTTTVKALSGSRNMSAATSRTYTLDGTPRISPDSGTLANQTSAIVTIKSISPEVRYTLDGTDPSELSTGYTAPLTLSTFPVTLKARAFWTGAAPSGITTVTYTQTADGVVVTGKEAFYPQLPFLFVDSRDGQGYKAVTIGAQTWMAQNLNYAKAGSCYGNDVQNCTTYGHLYDWLEVMDGICPTGWHVPRDVEWDILMNTVGGSATAGTKLKANTWGTDDHYFTALPAGYRYPYGGVFTSLGDAANFWSASASAIEDAFAWSRGFGSGSSSVTPIYSSKTSQLSLRCLAD